MAEVNLDPAPFKLKWVRQGKVAWRSDWVAKYGPARSDIPGLEQHVGFANFDLKRNHLPVIEKDTAGELYVMTIRPITEAEMLEVFNGMLGYFHDQTRARAVFQSRVFDRLDDLASVLNFVAYHGFMPANDSPGLQHLRKLFPATEYPVEFPDGPSAGL